VFIGYLSSFFIALLLSFFYLGYAVTGVVEQISREMKKDLQSELSGAEVSAKSENAIPTFIFDCAADVPQTILQVGYSVRFVIGGLFVDDDIPIKKACLSDYFLRPPPVL
jgi:hypothetical protein